MRKHRKSLSKKKKIHTFRKPANISQRLFEELKDRKECHWALFHGSMDLKDLKSIKSWEELELSIFEQEQLCVKRLYEEEKASYTEEAVKVNPSDIFGLSTENTGIQCVKCKSFKVRFMMIQKRRGDEGMTTFAECEHCHMKWKP